MEQEPATGKRIVDGVAMRFSLEDPISAIGKNAKAKEGTRKNK